MTETHGSMRAAFSIALVTALLSGALLYQTNVRSGRPPTFSRGGSFAQRTPEGDNLTVPTPTPTPTFVGSSHSTAVLTAESEKKKTFAATDRFPPLGRYTYKVDGTESAQPFGSRAYPPEMVMSVARPKTAELKPDEFVFDLAFSDQHKERDIVEYQKTGLFYTYEAGDITFGPGFTQSDEASYEPPMLQIPLPLKAGTVINGKSEAHASDGSTSRTEHWTVGIQRQEKIEVLGRTFNTWVVTVHRQTEPGGNETVDRTRTYWYSTEGNIWLKWTEDFAGSKRQGPTTFNYTSKYTATLERVEPL